MGALDVIFPRYCLGQSCDGLQHLLAPSQPGLLCADCRTKHLTWIEQPSCLRCGQWYGEGALTFDQCRNCVDQPHAYTAIRSALVANDQTMELMKAWKYEQQVGIWQEVKTWIPVWLQQIEELKQLHDLENPLIVPVPTTRASYIKRGFNQAQWLAQALLKQTKWSKTINYSDCLISKNKNKQARLLRSQRIQNLANKGANNQQFALKKMTQKSKDKFSNRHILLIDDICTTGATAHACAKVLKRELKAEKVCLLTLLRKTW